MNAFVHMTGPHPSAIRRGGKPASIWHGTIVSAQQGEPQTPVYKVFTYRRAVALSCDMARDRRLFLRMDALPQ